VSGTQSRLQSTTEVNVTVRAGYGEWHIVEVTIEVTVRVGGYGEWHTVEVNYSRGYSEG
jgi:hypothetical protein